jgi:hypothetical protein
MLLDPMGQIATPEAHLAFMRPNRKLPKNDVDTN